MKIQNHGPDYFQNMIRKDNGEVASVQLLKAITFDIKVLAAPCHSILNAHTHETSRIRLVSPNLAIN